MAEVGNRRDAREAAPNPPGLVADWLEQQLVRAGEQLGSTIPVEAIEDLHRELDRAALDALDLLDDAGRGADTHELPLRLPKGRLTNLARCERLARSTAAPSDGAQAGVALLRGAALDRYVIHRLRGSPVTAPVDELASMFDAEGDHERFDELADMDRDDATRLLTPLAGAAESFARIDEAWWPRTQTPAAAVLADGRVVCSGRIDVEFGGPLTGLPALALEVKSGSFRSDHASEAHLYALLVSLRDRTAPFAVGLWYPGAEVVTFPVSIGVLRSACVRLCDAIALWGELVAGRRPSENPGAWCAWCPDADRCPSAAADPDAGPDWSDVASDVAAGRE